MTRGDLPQPRLGAMSEWATIRPELNRKFPERNSGPYRRMAQVRVARFSAK
jgi:hypothetical protein